jgi:hypothetical protein
MTVCRVMGRWECWVGKAFLIISHLHYIQVCLPVRYWFNETAESEVITNDKKQLLVL